MLSQGVSALYSSITYNHLDITKYLIVARRGDERDSLLMLQGMRGIPF